MHESHQGRIAAETTPEDKGRTTGAAATTSRAATANNRPYGNGLRVADNGYIVTGYLFLIYPNALRRTITNTNQKIKPINHDHQNFCDCNSSNLIYLLKCNKCSLQYVGQTGRKLKSRIAEHRNSIKKGKGSCPFLIKHFSNSGPCFQQGFTVNVLEKLEGSGLTDRNIVNTKLVDSRKKREKFWMLKMRSVYPYGMNHDFGQI